MDGLDFVKGPDPWMGGAQNGPKVRKLREIFEQILDDFWVDFVRIHMFPIFSHGKVWFCKI